MSCTVCSISAWCAMAGPMKFLRCLIAATLLSGVLGHASAKGGVGSDTLREEVTVPYVADERGFFLTYELSTAPNRYARLRRDTAGEHGHVPRSPASPAEEVNVVLPTSIGDLHMVLHLVHDLVAPWSSKHYEEGNITYAAPVQLDCFYQGYLKERADSAAALTTCEGLSGIFQLEKGQQYAIEPAADGTNSSNGMHNHVIKRLRSAPLVAGGRGNPKSHGRLRRRSAVPAGGSVKHLEVMFVSDNTMINFHGKRGVELYLLSLLNVMNLIYRHSSLGIEINVVLVKILYADDKLKDGLLVKGDVKQSLERFCQWSSTNSIPDEADPQHYDVAIYFTRVDIGPAGYAPVTGMCRPDRSCGLIRDDGFASAFVAAHEIGHMMGLQHDDQAGKCAADPKRGSVMAPMVMATLDAFHWSECSKDELAHVIGSLYCMNDNPFSYAWNPVHQPMGANWNVNEQCRKEFGEGHRLCNSYTVHFSPCEMLWCSLPENRLLCKTKKMPPLPGTTCGNAMWCFRRRCVVASADTAWGKQPLGAAAAAGSAGSMTAPAVSISLVARPVDGGWSTWTAWSECTRTCGRGLRSRERACNSPEPSFGGKDCPGEGYDFKICNTGDCDKKIDDPRQDQCTALSKRGKPLVSFQPDDEQLLCRRNCIAKDRKEMLTDSDVDDGTFCSYEDRHSMCFAGSCLKIGCDGVFGSKATEDQCGVCNGSGDSCMQKRKHFSEVLPKGYQRIMRLPNGTRNVIVTKPYEPFYLSLVNSVTKETLLTANGQQEASKTFVDSGMLWRYNNGKVETLQTKGPLLVDYDLVLYALYNGERPHVTVAYTQPLGAPDEEYSFVISATSTRSPPSSTRSRALTTAPERGSTAEVDRQIHSSALTTTASSTAALTAATPSSVSSRFVAGHDWVYDKWTECSKSCGGGVTEVVYVCKNRVLKRNAHPSYCDLARKPRQDKRSCNRHDCVLYRWVAQPWQPCTVTCGGNGRSSRALLCFKSWISDMQPVETSVAKKDVQVHESYCATMPPPQQQQTCGEQPCPGVWTATPWQPCSATCGPGAQTREALCVLAAAEESVTVECSHSAMPETVRNCSAPAPCEPDTVDIRGLVVVSRDADENYLADEPPKLAFLRSQPEETIPFAPELPPSMQTWTDDEPTPVDSGELARSEGTPPSESSAGQQIRDRGIEAYPGKATGRLLGDTIEETTVPSAPPVTTSLSSDAIPPRSAIDGVGVPEAVEPSAKSDARCRSAEAQLCKTIATDRCSLLLFRYLCCVKCGEKWR